LKYPKLKVLAAMMSSALLLGGCGGGGGSSDTPGNLTDGSGLGAGGAGDAGAGGTDNTINPYSGASSIQGTVSLSSLTGADASVLGGNGQQAKRQWRASPQTFAATRDDAILKLYVVGPNGELQDTGMDCQFTDETDAAGNPAYSCDGIADGRDYVIKYLRLLDSNKALEMKVSVKIPEGAAEVPAEPVSPSTTVVVDSIISAILSATEGKEIDQAVVEDIISSVKKAVVGLIQSGAVQIPSMIVEAPRDKDGNFISDVQDLAGKDGNVKFDTNEGVESAVGVLVSDESVANEVDAAKVEIEIREIEKAKEEGDAGKAKFIRKIFSKLLDGDAPGFLVDFFSGLYNQDVTRDAGSLFGAIKAGLRFNQGPSGEAGGEPAPALRALPEPDAVESVLAGLNVDEALAAFERLLDEMYRLRDKKDGGQSLTEDEKKRLAEIPAIIQAVFPATEWRNEALTPETAFNVPQGIVFTIFVTDHYVPKLIEAAVGQQLDNLVSVEEGGDGRGVNIKFDKPFDFDPMYFDPSDQNPGLMQLFGFFDKENLAKLQGVEIQHLDIHPGKIWIASAEKAGGAEYDALQANVCVNDLSAFNGSEGTGNLSVELTYPTHDGERKHVVLDNERDLFRPVGDGPKGQPGGESDGNSGPGPDQCFVLDPWAKANHQRGGSAGQPVQPTLDDIISDFVSGKYTVKVSDEAGNVVAERDFERKVIVGMKDAAPQLTTPHGQPRWPQACQFKGDDEECQQRWEELNRKWQAEGGITTFALNVDTDEDGVPDKAKVTFKWTPPRGELPEGVRVGYSLNVLKNSADESGQSPKWENIYFSGEKGRRLFGQSFTLPEPLDRLEAGQGRYSVNVCAEFIDTGNGNFLGQGGCGFADFYVGEPLNPDTTFTIQGKIPEKLDGPWKVALISEEVPVSPPGEEQPAEPVRKRVAIADPDQGTYTLQPRIGDFLKGGKFVHFAITFFRDDNGDEIPNFGGDRPEPQFWPRFEDQIRFETWDGVLRVVKERISADGETRDRKELVITGDEKVEGPDFSGFAEDPILQAPEGDVPGDAPNGPAVSG